MSAIFILIGASLAIATGFLVAFIRSAKAGQFEDSYTPGVRILFENEVVQKDTSLPLSVKKEENKITR